VTEVQTSLTVGGQHRSFKVTLPEGQPVEAAYPVLGMWLKTTLEETALEQGSEAGSVRRHLRTAI
jgi:hypothetical protein